jgi:hypothetical protein
MKVMRITFFAGGNSVAMARLGWSIPEQLGTWSDGARSRLVAPGLRRHVSYRATAVLGPYLSPPTVTFQDLQIVSAGSVLMSQRLTGPGEIVFDIPAALIDHDGQLVLDFKCPTAAIPQALGLSGDVRRLGFSIWSLELAEQPTFAPLHDQATGDDLPLGPAANALAPLRDRGLRLKVGRHTHGTPNVSFIDHDPKACSEDRPMNAVTDEHRPDLGGNIRHGDANTFCPYFWRYLIDRFAVRSLLDVGCGEGHAVRFFQKHGVLAHGIEGLITNVLRAVVPIALHDLLRGPYVMPVDLVWSCEVAEHIHPDFVHNYVDTLANGRIVAMTHAVPGQDGHSHVNCQPAEYWIALMAARGFVLERSQEVYRGIAAKDDVANYFQHTGLVFVRS